MKKNCDILTPIPTFQPTAYSEGGLKSLSEEKLSEVDTKNENVFPSNNVASTQSEGLPIRRNSAFSIYEALSPCDFEKEDSGDSEDSSSKNEEGKSKRSWKREKKDKRELRRLETKNLNRYFRSKINEMLREVKENPHTGEDEKIKAQQVLELLNKSNKIMFSEIREIMKDQWLQNKLTSCSAGLLKYIHGGKMGMQSKLIMLKYFNKIMKAIRNPENFVCWK